MNRRDFFKWIGRLFAALPFIALADLEPEYQEGGIITDGCLVIPGQYSDKRFYKIKQQFKSFSWDLETPKEEVERLSEILAEAEEKSFWQRLLELYEDEEHVAYVWKE